MVTFGCSEVVPNKEPFSSTNMMTPMPVNGLPFPTRRLSRGSLVVKTVPFGPFLQAEMSSIETVSMSRKATTMEMNGIPSLAMRR
jgi:hypothetical protein